MRYSRISSEGMSEYRYGPRRALNELKALACQTESTLFPILFRPYFEELLQAIKARINGDLAIPDMPLCYVATHGEGTAAVVSLLYASLCSRRGNVALRVEENKDHVCLYMELGEGGKDLLAEKEEDSLLALLRSVAKNSGISLSVTADKPSWLCLRFERYMSVVQVTHSGSEFCHFAAEDLSRYLSLVPRISF